MKHYFILIAFILVCFTPARAQDAQALIAQYVLEHQSELQLDAVSARTGWRLSDQHQSKNDPVTHVYVQQTLHGLDLFNAVSTVAIQDGRVRFFNSRFEPVTPDMVNALPESYTVSAREAIKRAAQSQNITFDELAEYKESERFGLIRTFRIFPGSTSFIRTWPIYQKTNVGVRLAWHVELPYESDHWSIRVDALDGSILAVGNYTVYCNFSATDHGVEQQCASEFKAPVTTNDGLAAAAYYVVPYPGESPAHANFTLISDPSDPQSSPYGWHNISGIAGETFTITRGNNTYTYEDADADNNPGYSPEGGSSLQFNFPFDNNAAPITNRDAAMANLFYANNFMHDMTAQYGFDESAGNYQARNYSNTGLGGDEVNAEALDGSGTSNANFSAPPDGNNGRMQMFIFTAFNPNGVDKDSGLDNGIVAHEFGHGVSIRLTGGASNSSCLFNQEQMGEGWSDYYSLITTIKPGETRNALRPIGTYALGQPLNGAGIRNQVYSTDMSVNTYTYEDLKFTSGQQHNVGELWATMLWDLTWDLIDSIGFDPDPIHGQGGNNIAQKLVTDGMKLQPCSPGFIDGRDAILQADQLYFNGDYQCVIWKAFARRGLGYSADQGSTDNVVDGTEAFDIPPFCLVATAAPVAGFVADRTISCLEASTIQFSDQSLNIAQYWLWDFGDGTTSTKSNPAHKYTAEGTYDVKLIVINNIGTDTLFLPNYITISTLPAPIALDTLICPGQMAQLNATLNDANNIAEWMDAQGNVLFSGTQFITPVVLENTSYLLRETSSFPIKNVGPTSLGAGGFHNTADIGKIYFTAERGFTLRSALVRAQGAGNRNVQLYDEAGNVLQSYSIFMASGQKRVDLNIVIPGPGNYALGAGPNTRLFRSSDNVNYPYILTDLVRITGAGNGQNQFYFYFYDWEVQETACVSATKVVNVSVSAGPLANFSIATNSTLANFTDLSTGNPTSWFWDFGDGSSSIEANPQHNYTTLGVFPVTLTVGDGNCLHTFTKTLDFTSGSTSLTSDVLSVQIVPNPASTHVDIHLKGIYKGQVSIKLYNTAGLLMRQLELDTPSGSVFNLNLEDLPAGIYFAKVETTLGVLVQKLILR
jgi:PKD repeat protein